MSESTSLLLGRTIAVGRPNLAQPGAILDSIGEVLAARQLTNNGPVVQRLESVIGEDLGAECVLTSSGTTALELSLRTLRPGEVILPSFTFVATASAVVAAGHSVVFADVDPISHCLSVETVSAAMSADTTAILPVHLWGNPASPVEFEALAAQSNVTLLFDAAHAYGTAHQDKPIGQFGAASAFSFHATKAFSAVEGGCIATTDSVLAQRLRAMRTFGMDPGGTVKTWGSNYRMSEVHAAVGLANHSVLDDLANSNRQNFEAYRHRIEGSGVGRLIAPSAGNRLTPYVIMQLESTHASKRKQVVASLARRGIIVREYFTPPVHRMQPYCSSNVPLPVTEQISGLTLALPTGFQLNSDECVLIADEVTRLILEGDLEGDKVSGPTR